MEPKLIHGDCLLVMRELAAESVDVVVTSPPYNLGIGYGTYRDTMPREAYLKWTVEWCREVKRLLKPNGSFFLNIGAAPSNPMLPYEVILSPRDLHGSAVFGKTGAVRRFYLPEEDAYRASLLPDGSVAYQGTIVVTNQGIAGTFAQLRVMDSKGRKISETGFIRHSGPDGSKLTFFEWLRALPDGLSRIPVCPQIDE
jgi:hypothetical protein